VLVHDVLWDIKMDGSPGRPPEIGGIVLVTQAVAGGGAMRKKLVHRASGGRQPRRRRWDARQQVLSALHIWSDGQLIKHDEDGYVLQVKQQGSVSFKPTRIHEGA
jgi:hypothetical protein